jgi:hypothetical protein
MTDIKEMGFVQTLKDLPNRFITLLWKMLSVKFMGFVMAVWLIWTDKVTGAEAVALFCISFFFLALGREMFKYINDFK